MWGRNGKDGNGVDAGLSIIKKVNVWWVYRLMVHPSFIFAVMGEYDDIINLPHYVSKKHPQMTMWNRAAQFAPFAAVKGYEEAIKETVRKNEESYEPQYEDIQMY